MEKFLKREIKRIKAKTALPISCVVCSDFKTVITDYNTDKILYTSPKIVPIKKDDKITLNGEMYEVSYCDWNFDKGIFEICVWEP